VSYQIGQVHALSAPDFRRLLGVKRETFEAMLAVLTRREAAKKKKGRPPDLTLEQQLLLALQFWREYRTHYHLARVASGREHGAPYPPARRERVGQKRRVLPARASKGGRGGAAVAGPGSGRNRKSRRTAEKKQCACYSGKKKRHTLKSQVAVDKATGTILAVACGKGREHDFRLFKRSKLHPHPNPELLADSGYQGLAKRHPNSRTPYKRRRKTIALTPEQQAHNRAWASERVLAENVIRRLKVFRVLKETCRHRRKRFGLRIHLLAGLYNHDLQVKS
jgi:hypothetical protein